MNATKRILELRKSWTKPMVIAMADFSNEAVKKSVLKRGAHHFVSKPVNMEELLKIISPPPGFAAELAEVDILEYVQFMLLTGKKLVLEVRSEDGECCRLFVEKGNIVEARLGDIRGDEAFYRCVRFKGGKFANLPWCEPATRTITRSGDALLFEASTRRDRT